VTVPVAFLSHSWQNSDIATRLAADLREQGVDVWYDKWEIKPGDSLRRKVDEGIERASFFLVLLTPESIGSEWVQVELDAGMVRRIHGHCKLIPMVLGIADDKVPPTLQGFLWVPLDNYEEGLRRLLETCHGVDTVPPLGPPPPWATERPFEASGLSGHAQRLAALLCEKSEHGILGDPTLSADDVLAALGITLGELALAADELEERFLVKRLQTIGQGKAGFRHITPTEHLFIRIDPFVKGWDPVEDAKTLAVTMVNAGTDYVRIRDIDQALKWGPRRMNPALSYLALSDNIQVSDSIGTMPYRYSGGIVTPRTKRFARE
jgi:hypothetical protein